MGKYKFTAAQDTTTPSPEAGKKADDPNTNPDAETDLEKEEKRKRIAARNNKIKELQKQFAGKKKQLDLYTSNDGVIDQPHLIMENQENIPDDYSKLEATKECELK